ncbi:arginine deiminase [[Mycoplasma] testudinis]|uniref:arginine deiminase n=1 Tax=[Mycoplasma] testudinis TaxID=33924 RepID=UPI0004851DB5|nr:arginine deiminase family protein [[Mycoplasma] testudinis]
MKNINVYSEVGKLKEVVVHTPGEELHNVAPSRLQELLTSAVLEPEVARKEHLKFIKILNDYGVKVIQIVDLITETYEAVDSNKKEAFINNWLDNSVPKLTDKNRMILRNYLTQFSTKAMIRKMISGIRAKELNLKTPSALLVDPMPNLCFARDTFACVGSAISLSTMKHPTRRREALLTEFIFQNHPKYKDVIKYFDSKNSKATIEGGDIFVYNPKTLVVGNSERTNMQACLLLAKKIQSNPNNKFEKIVIVNVPPLPHLMHLDTWLTMVDYDKFIYSPNILHTLKFWVIDLKKRKLEAVEKHNTLKAMLRMIIKKEPILIPVGDVGADQLDIDLETHFDATNYLALAPGVVVGYDRNIKTQRALEKAGVKVLSFSGNQLSLAMGSARCLSMPLIREEN